MYHNDFFFFNDINFLLLITCNFIKSENYNFILCVYTQIMFIKLNNACLKIELKLTFFFCLSFL